MLNKIEPWLCLKSWTFSDGKTVNSVKDSSSYNQFKQINIFNQPTWYNHIMIKTPNDLINVLKDIYNYHLYYNSHAEKLEQLEIYKKSLENIKNKIPTLKNAYNIPKSTFWKDLKNYVKIYFWAIPICYLSPEQIQKEIDYIEKEYIPARKIYTRKYWEDLILDYFNYISLDEAQIYFGARSWDKNFSWKNEFLKDFISYPVKLNSRLEPIVQNPNMLDVNFRRQASTYKLHKSFFFNLVQRTEIIEVDDPENVKLKDREVISKSYRINFFKIFWYPRYQYYRKHLIRPGDPDIYEPWLYFSYVKKMTELKKQIEIEKQEKKEKFKQKIKNFFKFKNLKNEANNLQNTSQKN